MGQRVIKCGSAQAAKVQRFCLPEEGGKVQSSFASQITLTEPHPAPATTPESLQEEVVATAELSNGPAEAERSGYEEGLCRGEKTGMEIARQKIETMMKRYTDAIFEIDRLKSSLYTQVEREVVKLAIEVAKKIVRREIQADQEIIQTLVRVALSHVAEKSAVTIRLSPIDYNYLLEKRTELSQEEGRDIALLADRSIERGGCLIQTECGDIDARIEEEFREVEHAFFEGLS